MPTSPSKRRRSNRLQTSTAPLMVTPPRKKGRKGSLLSIRTDNTEVVSTLAINQEELETHGFKVTTPFKEKLNEELGKVSSHLTPQKVVETSENGSPEAIEVITKTERKRKLILKRKKKIRPLSFYTDQNEDVKTDSLLYRKFVKAKKNKKLPPPNSASKLQTLTLTKKSLKEVKANIQKNHGRRRPDQKTAMGGVSGKDYAADVLNEIKKIEEEANDPRISEILHTFANIFNNPTSHALVKCEILHLMAHALMGNAAQHSGNLIYATNHANTDMMLIEGLIRLIANKFPEVYLEVRADLVPGTHLATTIYYLIRTNAYQVSFMFNALDSIKPSYVFQKYTAAVINSLNALGDKAEGKKENNAMSQETSKKSKCLFFQNTKTPTVPETPPLQKTLSSSPSKKSIK